MTTTTFDTQLLYSTLSVQSASRNQTAMQAYLERKVRKMGATTVTSDRDGNIYVTKDDGSGLPYPTVIAHMDTVHKVLPSDQFAILSLNGTWIAYNPVERKATGIGGDDKVGIFIALTALKKFDRIKIAFFVDEEIGCQGSRYAEMDFFDDSSFVIQCDRKGYGDVVRNIFGTDLFGDQFERAITPYLKKYKMKTYDHGGLTDVLELKEQGLNVACTNISCGYYLPHTDDEFINLNDVRDTMHFVHDIIANLGDTQWKHRYERSTWNHGVWKGGKPYHTQSPHGKWQSYSFQEEMRQLDSMTGESCSYCGEWLIDCQCELALEVLK